MCSLERLHSNKVRCMSNIRSNRFNYRIFHDTGEKVQHPQSVADQTHPRSVADQPHPQSVADQPNLRSVPNQHTQNFQLVLVEWSGFRNQMKSHYILKPNFAPIRRGKKSSETSNRIPTVLKRRRFSLKVAGIFDITLQKKKTYFIYLEDSL